MSTLEEEILATEQAVAGAAGTLAEFWERSATELGLLEEYVPEPIAGTTAAPLLEYVPSAIKRKPTRPVLIKIASRPPVAEERGESRLPVRRDPGEDRERLQEVLKRVRGKVRECRRSIKRAPLQPLARLKKRLQTTAGASRPPPAGRSNHATPEQRRIGDAVRRVAESTMSRSSQPSVPTCAPPTPAPPALFLTHKGRKYPAQKVKLPNGPEVFVPVGFAH